VSDFFEDAPAFVPERVDPLLAGDDVRQGAKQDWQLGAVRERGEQLACTVDAGGQLVELGPLEVVDAEVVVVVAIPG
jgi:hypothetical protein